MPAGPRPARVRRTGLASAGQSCACAPRCTSKGAAARRAGEGETADGRVDGEVVILASPEAASVVEGRRVASVDRLELVASLVELVGLMTEMALAMMGAAKEVAAGAAVVVVVVAAATTVEAWVARQEAATAAPGEIVVARG